MIKYDQILDAVEKAESMLQEFCMGKLIRSEAELSDVIERSKEVISPLKSSILLGRIRSSDFHQWEMVYNKIASQAPNHGLVPPLLINKFSFSPNVSFADSNLIKMGICLSDREQRTTEIVTYHPFLPFVLKSREVELGLASEQSFWSAWRYLPPHDFKECIEKEFPNQWAKIIKGDA